MRSSLFQICAVLAGPYLVLANFDTLAFSSDATNFTCPDMIFSCTPPAICAHEFTVDKYYCCYPNDGVCTGFAQTCGNDKRPSASQQLCQKSDGSDFCCAKNREECTEIDAQFNVCWSTTSNPVVNATNESMNKTFSSLRSASPSATLYSVNMDDISPSSTTASLASSSTTSSATSSATSTSESSTSQPKSTGLSGGAIGGIVVGVLGGLALASIAAFLLWRRHKAGTHAHAPVASTAASETDNPYTSNAYHMSQPPVAEVPAVEKRADYVAEAPGHGGHELLELDGGRPAELEGSGQAARR